VLDHPGEQDLTAHVDFAALAEAAGAGGRSAASSARAAGSKRSASAARLALAARNPADTDRIAAARRRLVRRGGDGALFKVMALRARLARVAGLESMIASSIATATPADAEALASSAPHLHRDLRPSLRNPADLELFLQNHTPDVGSAELADPAFAVRVAEATARWSAMPSSARRTCRSSRAARRRASPASTCSRK
jgi:hypothetical protein